MTPQPPGDTPTPRTDEEWTNFAMSAVCHNEEHNVVRLKYARTLERELTSALAQVDELRRERDEAAGALKEMKRKFNPSGDLAARVNAIIDTRKENP